MFSCKKRGSIHGSARTGRGSQGLGRTERERKSKLQRDDHQRKKTKRGLQISVRLFHGVIAIGPFNRGRNEICTQNVNQSKDSLNFHTGKEEERSQVS